ncbi:hypothetical protein [Histidinibacterium aquaticum]|uniref:Uncharacterized protein n=1 Tax=Histidinibacterium aquaticum TaxID=2613962 RepID=A0A5J5GPE0_9RHOB|nr:hypothetical protein [Histidinibacterium aquaticum]KAA9010030.1 hypothetical protein F3S47_01880 [Histidinibacterium aquaticum]
MKDSLRVRAPTDETHCKQVQIATSRTHDADALAAEDLRVDYRLCPTGSPQRVLRDRLRAEPDIDLKLYKCAAVFDWLDIAVLCSDLVSAKAVHRAIKRRGPKIWISGPERKKHYHGDVIVARLQDPTRAKVSELCQHLSEAVAEQGAAVISTPQLFGMELAIDFYVRHARELSDLELIGRRARMSDLLRKLFAMPGVFRDPELLGTCQDWPRFCDGRPGKGHLFQERIGEGTRSMNDCERLLRAAGTPFFHQRVPLNSTLYFGAKSRPIRYRLQDKISDNRKSEEDYDPLPLKERRSRIEVSLVNKDWEEEGLLGALDLRDVADLHGFKPDTLRKAFFNFSLPTFGVTEANTPDLKEWSIFERTGVTGLDLYHRSRNEQERAKTLHRRGSRAPTPRVLEEKGRLMAYSQLNDMVRRAMSKTVEAYLGEEPLALRLAA